jgi:CP family cyanate transporter-like MFS transporter
MVPALDAGGFARIEIGLVVHAAMLAARRRGVKRRRGGLLTSGMLSSVPDPRRTHDGAVPTAILAALVLVSLALRPQLAAIGPLSGRIVDDLAVSHAFVGLLTTIPILCMGLFAPAGPALAARLGVRGAIGLAAGTVAAAGLVRAAAPSGIAILAVTFVIGIGTAVSGPLLAMFVRGDLPDHRVAGTAAYAGGTTLGQALAAGVAVPAAVLLGGWRASLASVSAASALGVLAWLALTSAMARPRPDRLASGQAVGRLRLPVRRPIVWALGLLFGVQSAVFYGINAWLPSFYVERGWDPAAAAVLLSVASFAGLVAIVIAPIASRRGVQRRELLTAAAGLVVVGIGGVVVLPLLAWIWAAVLGAGLGLMFTVVLTLPTDVAGDAQGAGGASALMLLVGYLIASVAPFALGAVRDLTGSFAVSLWLLLALAATMVPMAWALSPARLHQGGRAPR